MSSLCERCPIVIKAENCCGSDPRTRKFVLLTNRRTGMRVQVCPELETDGSCRIYYERPQECKSYVCENLYAQGLDSSRLPSRA